MLKLLGSACILGAGGYFAIFRIRQCRKELETLEDLAAVLELISQQIRQNRAPLPQLLFRLSENRSTDVSMFFRSIAAGLQQGISAESVWQQSAYALPLTREEQRILAEIGCGLHGDESQICKVLSLASEELSKSLEKKRQQQEEGDKRTTALCLSAAALLVILLI